MSDAEIVRDVLTRATNETATKMLPVDVFLDASLALDRLESQNQALQERIKELEKVEKAARGVVGYLHRKFDDTVPGPLNIWMDELENALSPTQETDPE